MQKNPRYRSPSFQVVSAIVIGVAPVRVHSETRFEEDRSGIEPDPIGQRRPVPPAR
jgi:hypothetical protein